MKLKSTHLKNVIYLLFLTYGKNSRYIHGKHVHKEAPSCAVS